MSVSGKEKSLHRLLPAILLLLLAGGVVIMLEYLNPDGVDEKDPRWELLIELPLDTVKGEFVEVYFDTSCCRGWGDECVFFAVKGALPWGLVKYSPVMHLSLPERFNPNVPKRKPVVEYGPYYMGEDIEGYLDSHYYFVYSFSKAPFAIPKKRTVLTLQYFWYPCPYGEFAKLHRVELCWPWRKNQAETQIYDTTELARRGVGIECLRKKAEANWETISPACTLADSNDIYMNSLRLGTEEE